MTEGTKFNFYELAESIYSNLDEYDNLTSELYLNSEIIDIKVFKRRLQKEMSDIDCTPSKDCATIEEIQDFFKEIDNVPSKLQRHKKVKDLQRLNSTFIQRKDITKEFSAGSPPCNSNQTVSTFSNVNLSNSILKVNCSLTPKEIFKNFNDCKVNIQNIFEKFENNEKKMRFYNNEIKKVKEFISELDSSTKNHENQSNEDAFSEEEEKELYELVNAFQQFVFINENRCLYLDVEEHKNVDKLKVLMDTVNDLLKN